MPSNSIMLAKTLLYMATSAAGVIAAQVDEDVVTWTKPGVRYRAVSIILPPTSVVTETQTASVTATIRLGSRLSPVKRSVKRAFLNQWTYQGCIADNDHLPPLVSPFPYQLSSDEVTGAACMHFCDGRGNTLAATQNGNECWCGDEYAAVNVTLIDRSQCDASCAGAQGEICGGRDSLTVHSKAT